jgi:hypothetical protein
MMRFLQSDVPGYAACVDVYIAMHDSCKMHKYPSWDMDPHDDGVHRSIVMPTYVMQHESVCTIVYPGRILCGSILIYFQFDPFFA